MRSAKLEQDYAILSYFADQDGPVGATTLAIVLGNQLSLSQATIGRKLMQYDSLGFTRQLGRQGRVLTEAGMEQLKEWARTLEQSNHNEKLLSVIHANDYDALIDVLITRRALEREAAYLAAERTTPLQLRQLRANIEQQLKQLNAGIVPTAEDRQFHLLIAEISGNSVLLHALQLVWQAGLDLPYTGQIRRLVGGRLVVDHEQIVDAIAAKDSAAAAAMESHINHIINDVKTYYRNQSTNE